MDSSSIPVHAGLEDIPVAQAEWYVLRDLTRPNAKLPAYKKLTQLGFDTFTPMTARVSMRQNHRVREQVPVIHDLLFVHATRDSLDPVIAHTDTLQYRYLKGHAYCTPMTVADTDMHRFITAVRATETPRYYSPDELTPAMYGARIRMVCPGALDGIEGLLLKIRGSGKKRLLVELPGILAAAVEIRNADYIQLL